MGWPRYLATWIRGYCHSQLFLNRYEVHLHYLDPILSSQLNVSHVSSMKASRVCQPHMMSSPFWGIACSPEPLMVTCPVWPWYIIVLFLVSLICLQHGWNLLEMQQSRGSRPLSLPVISASSPFAFLKSKNTNSTQLLPVTILSFPLFMCKLTLFQKVFEETWKNAFRIRKISKRRSGKLKIMWGKIRWS